MTTAMIRLDMKTEKAIAELSEKWDMAKYETIERIIKLWLEQQQ